MTTLLGLDVGGRLVVFAGGGSVTERRVARFAAEGAVIRIVAPELTPTLSSLAESGEIEWRDRAVRQSDLEGAWFVHSATGDARTDRAVADWAAAARIFCVNASRGDHGSARMTAESRAGDLVVGVASNHGADPRRARTASAMLAETLAEGRMPARRQRRGAPGRVVLVGGGPGAADLLTIRGRRALAEADVVVADRLGPRSVLGELDPEVEIIDVGKTPGHHVVPQDEINRIIVEHALAGKVVVRLKGGDPFVFGRGGEEVAACIAAGVPVDVVPGISSAISVPAAAGIPVTHRGTSTAMHLVNGHDAPNAATLASLRDDSTTSVLLMGVERLPGFVAAALADGAPADRPAAIVENGSTDAQRTTRATLGTLVRAARDNGVRSPAVIIVGDVAAAGLLTSSAVREDARTG
ncbi:uroporphyrinogen-III C-methyltransferase [Agromyces atrinae]|uniref:uroporphyrinogen-III C-methyltransferase n=1 Tax=Agromyces atrinae TaxID=592376 RepID=A0A4Q2M7E3_9MICO|nr:uroporphyrinogen-III C-methyltransferase [Agromyces atrinae]NYD66566.1 uroporphyrin-III C-methyltransferase/precorrin-2 dehydrogenase/sirohydrochlorin ferrochelatase [Agromyces atrinae]RXZ87237.1 uroporphyrinogen-III C-methyltransferase [Agromyces atrinae]